MLKNITKSVVAVAVTPVDLVVDIATLPKSAFEDENPFHRTEKRLKQAADAMNKALED